MYKQKLRGYRVIREEIESYAVESAQLFSKNLMFVRELRRLSQKDLASMTRLSIQSIGHWEKYDIYKKAPNLKSMCLLAFALDIEVADFFKDLEKEDEGNW